MQSADSHCNLRTVERGHRLEQSLLETSRNTETSSVLDLSISGKKICRGVYLRIGTCFGISAFRVQECTLRKILLHQRSLIQVRAFKAHETQQGRQVWGGYQEVLQTRQNSFFILDLWTAFRENPTQTAVIKSLTDYWHINKQRHLA